MTQAIAQRNAAAGIQPLRVITPEKVELIKQTICRGASDTELQLFIDVCNRTGLDPLARQIYAVKRFDNSLKKDTFAYQISIDGFRLIAERTGEYRGQTEPEWCAEDGVWKSIWISDNPPFAARVGVFRAGFHQPLYRIAKYKNFVATTKEGKPMAMWAKMPDHMIAKVAEALALRAAFPQELSGLYAREEVANQEIVIGGEILSRETNPSPVKQTLSEAEKLRNEVGELVIALRQMGDEKFTGETKEERQEKFLSALRTFSDERSLGYKRLDKLSDLSLKHQGDFAGWLEGRRNELQEKAFEEIEQQHRDGAVAISDDAIC